MLFGRLSLNLVFFFFESESGGRVKAHLSAIFSSVEPNLRLDE